MNALDITTLEHVPARFTMHLSVTDSFQSVHKRERRTLVKIV